MAIAQLGQVNTTALTVPGLLVQIVPPSVTQLNGVPTNVVGVVGTAQWGPVNSPTTVGSVVEFNQNFGSVQARKYDLGTVISVAALQGANTFNCVRVTDGTDTAASTALQGCTAAVVSAGGTGYAVGDTITLTNGTVLTVATISGSAVATVTVTTPGLYTATTNPVAQASTSGSGTGATFTLTSVTVITLTSYYTGSLGNHQTVIVSAGSGSTTSVPTWKITNTMPGWVPEVFDNIGGTGATLYANIVSAINLGQSGLRGPSNLIIATVGTGTTAPSANTFTLAGGTDGATTITSATLVGQDTLPRKGMYALRRTGTSVGVLADADDITQWTNQVSFGLSEGVYMIGVLPAGTSIATAVSDKAAQGINSYAFKILHGDWCYWFDQTNNLQRLISPQGFIAGLLGNLSPQNSTLNKQVYGIIATQTSANNLVYSQADLQQLGQVGIDLVANPCPGGSYFGAQFGRNSSTDPTVNGDDYTRMTNYLASTYNAGMGKFVGTLFSPTQAQQVKATIDNFSQQLLNANMIAAASSTTPTLVAPGVEQINVTVQYLTVVRNLIINLEGGETVSVNVAPAAA